MYSGRDIQDLAKELARQRESRRDFVADTPGVEMVSDLQGIVDSTGEDLTRLLDKPALIFRHKEGDDQVFGIDPTAHQQICNRLAFPKRFYDRLMSDHPDLLSHTVSALFKREPQTRMLRTLDGNVRAFLSSRYRPLDNDQLAEVVFPVLTKLGVDIKSCEVTDKRMYVKFVTPRIQGEVTVGDVVQAGGVIRNSEVGLGSLAVDDLDYRLVCLNGMVRQNVTRRSHVGRDNEIHGIDATEFFKDDTREADDKAIFLKLRDTIQGMFTQERFDARLNQYRDAADQKIERPVEVVEVVKKRLLLSDTQKDSVLNHLIKGGDLSRWGLANAITRTSQDANDYDTATDLEAMGGKIIELPKNDWLQIATEADQLAA